MGRGTVQRGRSSAGYNHHGDGRYVYTGGYRNRSPRMSRHHRQYASPHQQALRHPGPHHYHPQHGPIYPTQAQIQWWNNLNALPPERRYVSQPLPSPASPRVTPPRSQYENHAHHHGIEELPSNHYCHGAPPVENGRAGGDREGTNFQVRPDHSSMELHHHYEWADGDDVNRDVIVRPRSCVDTTPKWCVGLPLFLGAVFLVIGGFFTDKSTFEGHGIIFFVVSTICLAFGTFLLLLEICICTYLCMGQETRTSVANCSCCGCCNDAPNKSFETNREHEQNIPITELQTTANIHEYEYIDHTLANNNVRGHGSTPSRGRPYSNKTDHRGDRVITQAGLTTIHETSLTIENEVGRGHESSDSGASMKVERPISFMSSDRGVRETAAPPPTLRTTPNGSTDSLNSRLDSQPPDEPLSGSGFSLSTLADAPKIDNLANGSDIVIETINLNNFIMKSFETDQVNIADKEGNVHVTTNTPLPTDGESLSGDIDELCGNIDECDKDANGRSESDNLLMKHRDFVLGGEMAMSCEDNTDVVMTTDEETEEDDVYNTNELEDEPFHA